jgi:hypothetical protein
MEEYAANDYVEPPAKKDNTVLIIVIAVVVFLFLCCCCITLGVAGYYGVQEYSQVLSLPLII